MSIKPFLIFLSCGFFVCHDFIFIFISLNTRFTCFAERIYWWDIRRSLMIDPCWFHLFFFYFQGPLHRKPSPVFPSNPSVHSPCLMPTLSLLQYVETLFIFLVSAFIPAKTGFCLQVFTASSFSLSPTRAEQCTKVNASKWTCSI